MKVAILVLAVWAATCSAAGWGDLFKGPAEKESSGGHAVSKLGEDDPVEQEKLRVQRQKDDEKSAAAAREFEVVAAKIRANPTKQFREFERIMLPLYRDHGLVLVVSQCGLRSRYWGETLMQAISMKGHTESVRLRLSSDESGVASQDMNNIVADALSQFQRESGQAICQRLLNSKDMARLDAMQYQVTGNYH
jgi:hypothetical protein